MTTDPAPPKLRMYILIRESVPGPTTSRHTSGSVKRVAACGVATLLAPTTSVVSARPYSVNELASSIVTRTVLPINRAGPSNTTMWSVIDRPTIWRGEPGG